MNKFLLAMLVLLLTTAQSSFAQKVDTLEYEGKQYFVYPFKKEVRHHSFYEHILKLPKQYSKEMNAYYNRLEKGDQTVTLEELRKMGERDIWLDVYDSKPDYYSRKLVKAARLNPYPLLLQNYSLEIDIIPSLDPIPDGEYIQLFENVCLTDEKGECQDIPFHIAGRFNIKNNALHGEAMWFNVKGDTLKHGYYKNGLREGEWKLETHDLDYSLRSHDVEQYIDKGYPYVDTTIEYYTYKNGAKNGPHRVLEMAKYPVVEGNYIDGEVTGEWIERNVRITYEYPNFYKKIRDRNNEVVTNKWSYAGEEDTMVVHKPWIRDGSIRHDGDDFNFYPKYGMKEPPTDLYRIAFEEEEDLEMEEESWESYDIYGGDDYYQDFGLYDEGRIRGHIFDASTGDFITRGHAIDSVGAIANYSGVIEERYRNGQLAYRYEFKNGALVSEDTVFWDNGTAHDVVEFVSDSNQYVRSIYDYDGQLFRKTVYDSIGDFERYDFYFDGQEYATIEGYTIPVYDYQDYYRYVNYDTLETEGLTGPVLVYKSWYMEDTSVVFESTFDLDTRTLLESSYATDGTLIRRSEIVFSEEYESWTGSFDRYFNEYEMQMVQSGTIQEYGFIDSVAIRNMRYYTGRYDVAGEQTLLKNGVPYTGDVSIDFSAKKTKLNKDGLDWEIYSGGDYRRDNKISRKRWSEYYKNRIKGKDFKRAEMSYLTPSELEENFGSAFYTDFMASNVQDIFEQSTDIYSYYGSSSLYGYLNGYMLDGKPHGTWQILDRAKKGEVNTEVEFNKGELHGDYTNYSSQSPFEYYRSPEMKALLRDSFPDEYVRYKRVVATYKNDELDGKRTTYNWLGEVLEEENFQDGYLNGQSIDRNNLITTYSNYKNGFEDGYYQTYLTLPERDSLLLYDLNFQDGALQGKSEAYHANGNLAKRGFFLNGEPIDDYEAFDSLGFRYHYVKFQYAYPIEEKLWEENKLSVRYQFDWEDSIEFIPYDITQSESVERLAARLGLIDDYLSLPYYGRSTLVDKSSVKYHMTKYFPNDTISRDGDLNDGKKVGHWEFFDYYGELLYVVDYQDSIFSLNDSVRFKSRGILTDLSPEGDTLYKAHIIEKFEKYDCSHTDHYEIRQLYTIWEADDSLGRMNGYVQNFYDNGVIQSEGTLKDGLPTGAWKIYDPFGKLNQYGYYVQGKRNGRWLSGDLSKTKYLGDICLNPNLPDLEKEIKYRENLLDITITNFKLGKTLNRQFYDLDMNQFRDVDEEELD